MRCRVAVEDIPNPDPAGDRRSAGGGDDDGRGGGSNLVDGEDAHAGIGAIDEAPVASSGCRHRWRTAPSRRR